MSANISESATNSAALTENEKNGNDSMEKLQVNEEDEKNVSIEDILGAQSLLMSDSDGEGSRSPLKMRISPKQTKGGTKKMTEEEQDQTDQLEIKTTMEIDEGISDDSDTEQLQVRSKKKITALIDSESETEQQLVNKKKTRSILSSDDDADETEAKKKSKLKPLKKMSALIDSDSEADAEAVAESNIKKKQKQKKQKSKKAIKQESYKDGDDAAEDNANKKSKSKFAGLVDSDSESAGSRASDTEAMQEFSNLMEDAGTQENMEESKSKKKQTKPMRASAKKAMDEMQAIQSEQQRLHREAHISIPYHQPKKHTLQEFLSRRTIIKPQVDSPNPVAEKKPPKNLKMSLEELEAYAKLMEERAKEATEFFKSESEDDEMERSEIADEETAEQTHNEEDNVPSAVEDIVTKVPENTIDLLPPNEVLESSVETGDMLHDDVQPSTSAKAVLITEVVELPKLDLTTLNISPPKPMTVTTPTKQNEYLKRLLREKAANVSPAIKGDRNMVIDLETGDMYAKRPTGVDTLLQRLMKTREARKAKHAESVSILSTENGKVQISKVKITTHEDEHDPNKEPKPGAAYLRLKQNLKSIITKKRMEELKKKKKEELEHEKCINGEDMEDDDEEMEYEPENKPKKEIVINDEEEYAVEEEDYDDANADDDEQKLANVDDDAAENKESHEEDNNDDVVEDEDDDGDDEDDDDGDETENEDEQEEGELIAPCERKNRIVRACQDDSDDEMDVDDFLQTPKMNPALIPTATQMQLSATKLFDVEEKCSASDAENELLNLCSGQFADTQPPQSKETDAIISQIPKTQKPEGYAAAATDGLLELCSGTFETQQPIAATASTFKGTKILSSSDEDEQVTKHAAAALESKPRTKKFSKKLKKKKPKLGFSDDEEEDAAAVSDSEAELEEADEVPETFVEYDSEENEVVVELTRKDRVMHAANFVENEAELSESDWGSADEDEKNLDKYDIELGDEDEFDREKIRTELEQIHARKMLDQDIREVRQIQEMLFEDEENDGVGRQRQFKWKNAESGFTLDESNRDENAADGAGSGDEENEHVWRKIRYEREKLLREKGLREDASVSVSPLSTTLINASLAAKSATPTATLRKLNIISGSKKSTVDTVKQNSPFLISKSPLVMQQQQKNIRGSFLVRDKETLNKLAGLTKGAAADGNDTGMINVKTIKAKNFVFATLTEEEHEKQKRKADDLLNSSNETGINFMKKPRIEPRREKCLIDQLL